MGSCAKLTFSNIIADQFTCICQQIESKFGTIIPGGSGEITQSGFAVEWAYNRETQKFDAQCLDSPFLVTCGTINQSIRDIADGCA
jgi:hypothetical protein